MKLTKRKGFNFFRSYYDVYNELSVKGKIAFMDALLDRQFLGVKPEGLKGMAKFAYISQTNSIDSQVKGYEDKTKTRLDGSEYNKDGFTPTVPPCDGDEVPPTGQEEEEEKEKEQYVYSKENFFKDWNRCRTETLNKPSHLNRLDFDSKNTLDEIIKDCDNIKKIMPEALIGFFKQQSFPNGQDYTTNSRHFLNHFNTYLQAYHDKNANIYGK